MNRRSFIERLALGMAGFTILPGAGRVWRVTKLPVIQAVSMEQALIPYQIALMEYLRTCPVETLYDFLLSRNQPKYFEP